MGLRQEACDRKFAQYHAQFYQIALAQLLEEGASGAEAEAERQAATEAFRIMCQTDLYFLATEIYGMDTAKRGGRRIWDETLHGLLCDQLEKEDNSLIWMSRHMLKTTVAKIWCVQQLIRDPVNVAILMGSMTAEKVEAELRSIKTMLLNKKLMQAFPDIIFPRKKWEKDTRESLTITRNITDEDGEVRQIMPDEAQIEVFGLEKTVIGRHPTHIYLDDVITDKNTTTAVQIGKAIDHFSAISSLKGIDTVTKIVGTPWHSMDLYHYIIENNVIPPENRIRIAGVHMAGDEEVIDYKWFTRKFLKQQKKEMRHLYWPQLHLDTRPREDRLFIPPYPQWHTLPEEVEYYIAVDPATGLGQDKSGIAVGAVDAVNTTKLLLVEAEAYDVRSEELADIILQKIVQYNPNRCGIELGLQAALLSLIRLKAQEMYKSVGMFPMPEFFEIKTGGGERQKKWQKIDNTFGAMLRDKRVELTPGMEKLRFQMEAFDKNKQKNDDDILDAVSMLVKTVPYFSYGYFQREDGEPEARSLTWKMLAKKCRQESDRARIFLN